MRGRGPAVRLLLRAREDLLPASWPSRASGRRGRRRRRVRAGTWRPSVEPPSVSRSGPTAPACAAEGGSFARRLLRLRGKRCAGTSPAPQTDRITASASIFTLDSADSSVRRAVEDAQHLRVLIANERRDRLEL